LEAVEFGQLKNVQQLMEEEANKVNEKQKQKHHKDVMEELQMIEKSLTKMIDENSRVTDIEMLERDEFVVDVMRQDKFIAEGEKVCDKIRKEAEKNVLRL
jgi:Fe2+ transport system protein B